VAILTSLIRRFPLTGTSWGTGAQGITDDATSHLLFTASIGHIPSLAIEQVFEAATGGAAPLPREKSKLSREERREEKVVGASLGWALGWILLLDKSGVGGVEKWSPGGCAGVEGCHLEGQGKAAGYPPSDDCDHPSVEVGPDL